MKSMGNLNYSHGIWQRSFTVVNQFGGHKSYRESMGYHMHTY